MADILTGGVALEMDDRLLSHELLRKISGGLEIFPARSELPWVVVVISIDGGRGIVAVPVVVTGGSCSVKENVFEVSSGSD